MEQLKILYLEDSTYDADIVKRILKKEGMDVALQVVVHRDEYRKALSDFKPDLILSDHSMFQFNSIEALNILKESGLQIPFILVTGTVSEEFAVNILREGANDYLLKENLVRLPNAIQRALKEKKAEIEKKQALDDLRKSEMKYRMLAEYASDLISTYTLDGVCTYVSPAIHTLLKYAKPEFLGTSIYNYIHPDDLEVIGRDHFSKASDPGKNVASFRMRCKDGSYIWVESSSRLIAEKNGNRQVMSILRDIGERRNAEVMLQEKVDELNSLIYRISHDLRGPIASIKGLLNLVEKEEHSDYAHKVFAMIRDSNNRLDNSIISLCKLIMIDSHEKHDEPVDFEKIMQDIIVAVKSQPESDQVEIRVDIAPALNFRSNEEMVYSMIYNLVLNSIKYRRRVEDSFVNVLVFKRKDNLVVEVSDNGEGIDKTLQHKVFNMFFRGNEKATGIGLGLYIVKSIVEKLKGTVSMESEEGQGTSITIVLPYGEA